MSLFLYLLLLNLIKNRGWLSGRTSKPRKSVRMNLPVEIPLRQKLHCAPKVSIVEDLPLPKEVSCQIEDLCTTLFSLPTENSCLGYIADEKARHHEVRPIKGSRPISRSGHPVSLQSLLAGENGVRLSRQERYKIASVLAASILQLQTTPWMTDRFDKRHIFFYHQDARVLAEYPYINHSFPSKKSPRTSSEPLTAGSRFADRESLSNLGILLLELCFGQPIESQEIRKRHLGSDGKPHSGTDYMTARDWTEMVFEEDPAFEHIIRCCVSCIFEEKPDWRSKSFTQAVYTRVVEPLEGLISKWSTP